MTTAESLSQSMALVGDQGTPCGRRWSKQWVPQETVLNPGKCMLLKWVTDDMLKSLRDEQPPVEEEPEEEYEVLYLCTYEGCGRSFTDQGALRKHTNIHGEKQFVCHYEGCGKRFMDSSKLKRHFLIHTGERPFVCPVDGCGKAFSLDFNLRSHMRTHTQENYHICPFEECGKRYAHEYKLRAHLRTCHEKVLPPEMKLAPPPLPPSLEKEIRIQKSAASAAAAVASASGNLERPFACHHPGCDKRYKHEYKLNLHLRKEHANEPQPRGKAVILQNRGVRKQQQHRDRMIREAEDDGMDDEGSEKEVVIRALANSRKAKTGRAIKTAAAAAVAKTAKRPRQRQRPKASVAATGPRLVLQPPKVRPGGRRKEVMVVVNEPAHADSEETEEEEEEEEEEEDGGGGGVDDDNDNDDDDGDDTEDDDIGRLMHVRKKPYEDDEETEDDDDME